jgi:hypothetical protein
MEKWDKLVPELNKRRRTRLLEQLTLRRNLQHNKFEISFIVHPVTLLISDNDRIPPAQDLKFYSFLLPFTFVYG